MLQWLTVLPWADDAARAAHSIWLHTVLPHAVRCIWLDDAEVLFFSLACNGQHVLLVCVALRGQQTHSVLPWLTVQPWTGDAARAARSIWLHTVLPYAVRCFWLDDAAVPLLSLACNGLLVLLVCETLRGQ